MKFYQKIIDFGKATKYKLELMFVIISRIYRKRNLSILLNILLVFIASKKMLKSVIVLNSEGYKHSTTYNHSS